MRQSDPEVLKKNMLNSAEHEIFLIINVKIVGILTFMSKTNNMQGLSGSEKMNFLIFFILKRI